MILSIHVEWLVSLYRTMAAKFPLPAAISFARIRIMDATAMIGAHAKTVVGWTEQAGSQFLEDLLSRATQPNLIYRHEWRDNDVVIWDNQAVLHRATPYDTMNHRRLMQRTTISSGVPAAE